ncbi:MAG TPA: porphobilinogen synthase [Longimicrobiales bacterium]|nr:porphobilinogen synthase [Longimicrobiales bacterium]
MSTFPDYRMRRLRRTPTLRRMVRETVVRVDDLILPLFAVPGQGVRKPVETMPGVAQTSVDELVKDAVEAADLGVPAVLLFGIPEHKDEQGSEAWADDGVVQNAIRAIKREVSDLVVITDVCMCEYTSHGHCGVVRDGDVVNDETLDLLARESLSHVRAGADMVAPSDMMDGRVAAIREALDDDGYSHIPIMSYAAKFASAFYGPFRDAAESAPQFGDRRSYQMDPANGDEAVREVLLDIEEGADIVMVKPALAYLDIIRRVKEETRYPLAAYHVSGEYAAIQAAARLGWLELDASMREALLSIKRAGADLIMTYWAREFARSAG